MTKKTGRRAMRIARQTLASRWVGFGTRTRENNPFLPMQPPAKARRRESPLAPRVRVGLSESPLCFAEPIALPTVPRLAVRTVKFYNRLTL
jgi:hypothetical protein